MLGQAGASANATAAPVLLAATERAPNPQMYFLDKVLYFVLHMASSFPSTTDNFECH